MNVVTLNLQKHRQTVFTQFLLPGMAVVLAVVVALQQYTLGSYNNFSIFSAAFNHLLQNNNLYLFYPQEYADLFLYNPTFAVLFAPFGAMPVVAGMMTWAVLSMLVYLWAVRQMPLPAGAQMLLLLLALPDSINSLQHMQVNHLTLALMLCTFGFLYREKPFAAAFCTVLAFYIKVYPAAVGLCFIFFPNKTKYLLACAVWAIALFALPLLLISWHNLLQQYQHWFTSLSADRTVEECATSLSLISINYQWWQTPMNPGYIQMAGLAVTLLPLALNPKQFASHRFQLLYLAALLLFVIVFNHAAESATYILAVTGAALWYVSSNKTITDKILLAMLIVGTILTVTDLTPSILKKSFIQPYSIRAVPCVFIWAKAIIDLVTFKYRYAQPHQVPTIGSTAHVQA